MSAFLFSFIHLILLFFVYESCAMHIMVFIRQISFFFLLLCSHNILIIERFGFLSAWWTFSNCQFFFLVFFCFCRLVVFFFQCPWHIKSWFSFLNRESVWTRDNGGKITIWEMIYVLFCFVLFFWKVNFTENIIYKTKEIYNFHAIHFCLKIM